MVSTGPTDEQPDTDNPYAGLLGGDPSHWAFGIAAYDAQSADPLAGVDATLPDGVDRRDLATYAVMLADDALVMSHRLSQWCSNAPDLEEDIALANTALDLLGQARLLLARAAAADPSVVPALPEGSPVLPEDALAYFREAGDFRNVRLAEVEDRDFADVVVRLLVFSTWRLALLERLRGSRDSVLAAVAAKGVKELAYHRDYAGRWFLTLAQGTDESRARTVAALDRIWPLRSELTDVHDVEARVADCGVGVDPSTVSAEVDAVLAQVFAVSDVVRPDASPLAGVHGRKGRDGLHTEALSRMLAEMQVVARAHPMGRW
ncbi:phenylacetate-CoA oxygenase subunit PaaC [Mumia zhuanghuii]|uniref:1,2-phenylacetyl-CoA epoxidase subunit PaaC n=2 Tax=Mumia TaxID=1546255 RepID=A0ABW1QHL4_9ACTN|nr:MULTISPECIES: 1,2-phenylacetyl-CoA epoxidase subunit PaaC [Mumia]KAA1418195.1 phenylacetate-CoA oxygenase subunit PaaC [Mumia zhuanghuii]